MLDMGFIHDIKKILNLLPKRRQTLMFSATFSDDIRQLAKQFLSNPQEVSVTPSNSTAKTVQQKLHPVDKAKKSALLTHLVKDNGWFQVLVFVRTKHGANKLTKQLNTAGIEALAIHGNKSQGARTKALAQFKANEIQVLVATDIAARGLDIDQLPHVINYDLPNVPEDYVHRIGRTGRAGATGEAISIVSADEIKQLQDIEQLIGKHIEREYVDDFDPVHELPASKPITDKKHVRRPKKKKPTSNGGNRNQPRSDAQRPPRRRSKPKPKNAGRRQQATNRTK
jgi:ATP-dependent RNA helicase RhlE